MINIVLSFAGRGSRFADAGYTKPKPLIDINGLPMIIRAVINIVPWIYKFYAEEPEGDTPENVRFIFVCLKSFYDEYGAILERHLNTIPYLVKYNIITVDQVTQGAACSVLLAKELINNDDELIITDCDHIVEEEDHVGRGIDFFRQRNADGGVWSFLSDDPKWSYVSIRNNRINQVVEKQVVSNLANTGTYYYKRGSDFVKYAEMIIRNEDKTRGEYYVSHIHNYMIANDLKVYPFLVNSMISFGVPTDVEAYLNETRQSRQL